MLNIGGDKSDRSYRYKMPPLQTKVEGRGNGIKTAITNIVDVAKALHVIPNYPTKFFGIELGAMSSFDAQRECSIVNGKHEPFDLQKILEKFIDQFVLCPTCKLPEIKMSVKRDRIKIDCAACGHNGYLASNHKLSSYIINHPPPKEARGAHKGKVDADEESSKEKSELKAIRAAAAGNTENVEWFTDTSEDAQKLRRTEEFGSMMGDVEKLAKIDALLAEAKLTKSENNPSTVLKVFIINKETPSVSDVLNELRRIQIARGLDEPQKIKALMEAVIETSDAKAVPDNFVKNAKYWKKLVTDETTAIQFINCIEDFVGIAHPELLARFPLILKALYEADILEDEHIIAWFDAPAENTWFVDADVGNATRAKAVPLVEWLRADDEDEDEE